MTEVRSEGQVTGILSEEKPEAHQNLEWRCLTCGQTAPPTPRDYMNFIKHPCKKRIIWLIDKDTGEQLANNAQKAIEMGFLTAPEKKTEGKEKAPETTKEAEVVEPQVSMEGIFRYTITLPADAFTLFNLAKTCGLERDGEKPFDEWVWDCIKKRFEKDYQMQLILAPVEE